MVSLANPQSSLKKFGFNIKNEIVLEIQNRGKILYVLLDEVSTESKCQSMYLYQNEKDVNDIICMKVSQSTKQMSRELR